MPTKNLTSYKELMNKSFLNELLEAATKIENNPSFVSKALEGKIIACLFFEPSTRTRLSFESAGLRLGAKIIDVQSAADSSMSKGESLEDTIKTVCGYVDAIVMRHPQDGAAERAVKVASVPIINAGDGSSQHPSQALLDLYTIKKHFARLDNLNFTIVGDLLYGRTIHSLIPILSQYEGNSFHLISPESLKLASKHASELKELNTNFTESTDLNLNNIPKNTDVLYMTRIQQERFKNPENYRAIKGVYILGKTAVEKLKPTSIVMHPLPRIDEIATEVDTDPRAKYFEQAHNGVFARMALLQKMLS
jgi:aspartate carbamoyltransferase catalytic subunit